MTIPKQETLKKWLKTEQPMKEDFERVFGDNRVNAEQSPVADIPVLPDGIFRIDRAWLIRWAQWVAAGRPEVKPVTLRTGKGRANRQNEWNPALHPRDPDTGQFVERPFDVPDDAPNFTNMEQEEIAQYIANNGGEEMKAVLDPETPVTIDGVDPEEVNVEERDIDGFRTLNKDALRSHVGDKVSPQDLETISAYENIDRGLRQSVNTYFRDVLREEIRGEDDYEKVRDELLRVRDKVDRASMSVGGTLKIRDENTVDTWDHEMAHHYVSTFGFRQEKGTQRAHDNPGRDLPDDGPVPRNEEEKYQFTPMEDVQWREVDDISSAEVGMEARYYTGGGMKEATITEVNEQDGYVKLEDGHVARPHRKTFSLELPSEHNPPEHVQELVDETNKVWWKANQEWRAGLTNERSVKSQVADNGYALNNANETFAVFHEAMQNPHMSMTSVWDIMDKHPDWVRAYVKNFNIPEETRDILSQADMPLRKDLGIAGGDEQ